MKKKSNRRYGFNKNLQEVVDMDTKNLRMDEKRNALWLGSIAGDAFVLGGHWIYDLDKLQASFPDYRSPQAPLPDSYHANKNMGDQTHYGDQARHLWQFLADHDGHYDPDQYRREWVRFISRYDGYMDMASKESLTALKKGQSFGSGSDELGGVARLAAMYYWMADLKQALAAAVDQNRMTHDSQQATAITVLIGKTLEMLLHPSENKDQLSVFETLYRAKAQLLEEGEYDMKLINESFDKANALEDYSARSIAEKLGQSCHARHALPAILAVLKQTDDYEAAMKLNVRVGGDSASRAMIIGVLLGAKLGLKAIPQAWLDVMRD